ncbi:RNA polymerase sigma-70 factor [Achromobacter xylosoxidans]|uniref:RNA polymerase sigma-70 factor n=1 Tax=Alcaligenes xylosoxydans xylosoxydans TaxID=85698 RepID=UPI0006C2C588|nr:RNA polymerase sigma-70 factor [Achromobacter xylosoxidans]MCH1986438.1 RNA polymerase sigma-70 factor [Achromobacter xylosoxidans]MCH4588994.1 RNA polymerase sigma-70 factor [Achromobacter xylosoxidans]QKI76130.1 RNA polymerase sigma-70 factor [Achromobacter xylosoxidans]CUJ06495.1 Probable RNA polymerase sigma factor fecI [Achromobacter xylosoxidans]CUJ07886.1 Probable RNA polymerase sigma factor fecI [Achromobacter xylosoxidans]
MTDSVTLFDSHRPRLYAIAYRMLGEVAEAEDVVQDAWLRWHGADRGAIENPEAWLVTVATRLSIDRLRLAKAERAHYVGVWLPEPMLMAAPSTPEQLHEQADDVSVAFLFMLERLSPDARAAFLMRDVFDADYEDIAQTLDKSQAAVRQLVRRARQQLRQGTPREAVPRATLQRLLQAFADAMQRSDFHGLHALLSDDAELIGDGGGKVGSFASLVGGRRLAQLFYAGKRRFRDALRTEVVLVNGQWALLRFIDGQLESVQSYETDGERLTRVLVQRNPDKLARIAAALARG